MFSGSPPARRRAVRMSGRSKWVNSAGALQAAGGTASGAEACGKAAGVNGRGAATTAASPPASPPERRER